MWAKSGHLMLVIVVAVAIGGCAQMRRWRQRRKGSAEPASRIVATTMPAAQAVKVFNQALGLVTDLRYQEAGVKVQSVVDPLDEAGDHRRAAEAVFWLAYCREKMRYLDSASKLYKRLIEKFPDSAAAARGKDRLGALKGKMSRS